MMEASSFFEPYRAVLDAFQGFTSANFPMADYVLGHKYEPSLPAYLSASSTKQYNFRNKLNTIEVA